MMHNYSEIINQTSRLLRILNPLKYNGNLLLLFNTKFMRNKNGFIIIFIVAILVEPRIDIPLFLNNNYAVSLN